MRSCSRTPRLWDGKYLSRDTHTTLSQKGNVAHAGRENARRIALFPARDSKLSESDFRPAAGPDRHSRGSSGGEVSRDHRRTDRGNLRSNPRTRGCRPAPPAGTLCRKAQRDMQCTDGDERVEG